MHQDVITIDEAALGAYLERELPGFRGPLDARKFADGQSNPTYLLTAGERRYVLRRKPPGLLPRSAHAIEREYRLLRALAKTDVPAPRAILLCEDPGVVGTAFFIMDFIDGRIFWDPALPELSHDERSAIFDEMNRGLAALHGVDPIAAGLADFGRPGNYFARQLARWSEQYRASETRAIADMDALITWLESRAPPDDGRIAIVHGDYRIDNLIFEHRRPKLAAILDWELSTLGHPFADLAYQCMQWRLPREGALQGLGGVDRAKAGIPSERHYVAAYCARMGIGAIENWDFFLAFSFFRLAAILQGVKKRALTGNASNPERGRRIGEAVPVLARLACEMIEKGLVELL